MAKIMAVNAGSSSLKFQLLQMPEETVITSGVVERIGMQDAMFTIKLNGKKMEQVTPIESHMVAAKMLLDKLLDLNIIDSYDEISGVGHRIVQGAALLTESCVLGEREIGMLESIIDLGPLHLKPHLAGIRAFSEALPHAKQIGVFDTAFHQTMPEESYLYALPYEWYEKYQVRKYGFHGTSHKYVSQRAAAMLGKKPEEVNIIVCHIGNGASLCAVKQGKSVDTSMGFTPLEGVPMGTRCGNIDPAVLEYVMNKKGINANQITNMLNKESGYIGISGVSSDSRDLSAAAEAGNHRAQLAIEIQAKRIADYIASYYVYMGGADAIAFTAGIGENAPAIRANIINRVKVLGISLDLEKNNVRGKEALISDEASKVKVFVIPTNEEVMIARDTLRLISE